MNDDFKELHILLRLKQHEQPPQGFDSYGERFLKEFHRRQRWESAKKTGFARWQEVVSEWMESFTVPRYAYAATLAVFGAIALGVNGLQPSGSNGSLVAQANPVSTTPVSEKITSAPTAFALNSQLDLSELEVQSKLDSGSETASSDIQPRYILDARPASYNAGFSF